MAVSTPVVVVGALIGGAVGYLLLRGDEGGGRSDLHAVGAEAWDTYDEVLHRSAPSERALAQDTLMLIDWCPQEWELRSVGLTHADRGRLLGIYYVDPSKNIRPTIVLYADNIADAKVSVRSVLLHEFGHRFGRDHSIRPAAHGSVHVGDGTIADVGDPTLTTGGLPGGEPAVWTSGCPVCLLHDRTALARCLARGIAHTPAEQAAPVDDVWSAGDPWWAIHDDLAVALGLADGLDYMASIDQRNPPGLGGTVNGINVHLDRATATLPLLGVSVHPDDVTALTAAIAAARDDYTPPVNPERDDLGLSATERAWGASWLIASAMGPGQATSRLRHTIVEAQALVGVVGVMIDTTDVSWALNTAALDCASTSPACATSTEAAWWAAYGTAARYFRRGR